MARTMPTIMTKYSSDYEDIGWIFYDNNSRERSDYMLSRIFKIQIQIPNSVIVTNERIEIALGCVAQIGE